MSNVEATNFGSYENIYNILKRFRRSGGRNNDLESTYNDLSSKLDTPGTIYFRMLFYFTNGRLLDSRVDQNLHELHNVTGSYIYNTAMNYLQMNNEFERASILQTFIDQLSSINTYSPWYFQKIEGLDSAIGHPEYMDSGVSIPDERRSITIECLPDSYDNRIGTMLDAYSASCYSHRLHKEIIPANLRKFDMAIYLFNTPLENMSNGAMFEHGRESVDHESTMSISDSKYRTSSKLIEFRNCEIDLRSVSTAYTDINNVEGSQLVYKIKIFYDYVVEQRYNEFLTQYIGDLIAWDMFRVDSTKEKNYFFPEKSSNDGEEGNSKDSRNELSTAAMTRLNFYQDSKNLWSDRGGLLSAIPGSSMYDEYTRSKDYVGVGTNLTGTNKPTTVLGRLASEVYNTTKDKAERALENLVDKYDPLTNLNRAINNATSGVLSEIETMTSSLLLGNIYKDTWTLRDAVDFRKPEEEKPISSLVGTNLYKGWLKS